MHREGQQNAREKRRTGCTSQLLRRSSTCKDFGYAERIWTRRWREEDREAKKRSEKETYTDLTTSSEHVLCEQVCLRPQG